jgi:hypothetical protein
MKTLKKNKSKSKDILLRLSKAGDQVYDGLTSNSPTLFPGGNYNDSYRKIERQNSSSTSTNEFIDRLELSKRLMTIDPKKYGVDENSASKLLDHIEQRNYDVIKDLELELKVKAKDLKTKMEEIKLIEPSDYLTEEDYERTILIKKKELIDFSNKITYIKIIIDTIKNYMKEVKELNDYSALNERPSEAAMVSSNQNAAFDASKLK